MSLSARIAEVDRQLARRQALRDDRQARVDQLEKEIEAREANSLLLERVETVIVELGKRTVAESSETLNKLATLGLKMVFPDQDLELRTTTDRQRGKTALKFNLYDRGKTFPIDDAFGGGVLALTGFLLRVSIIVSLKLRRIILLDETFAHLADVYIPNASKLMRKIADDLGFTIIMNTHQPEFASYAHHHVKASRRAGVTTMTAVAKGQ